MKCFNSFCTIFLLDKKFEVHIEYYIGTPKLLKSCTVIYNVGNWQPVLNDALTRTRKAAKIYQRVDIVWLT